MNAPQEHDNAEAHAPRARRRGAAGTRTALLKAAALRFGKYGYDGASVRDIARDAGVDATLVYRHFGSKDALFKLVSTDTALFDPLLEIPLEDVPGWLCDFITSGPASEDVPHPVLTVLRSPSREEAVEHFRDHVTQVFSERFAQRLNGPEAAVRAELVAAWLLGASLLHNAFRTPALEEAPQEVLHRHLRAGLAELLGTGAGEDSQHRDPHTGSG